MNRTVRLMVAVLALCAILTPTKGVSGQSLFERLSVHGYLSQAYGSASDYQIRGVPTDGTFDYRTAALQFRYAVSENDALVIQLSHRRLAQSPLSPLEPDVAFDWGFFQKRWAGASFRIGKVPIPKGLFNEVRDVGTILPFYQANKAFYTEGVETVDGITVTRAFEASGGWGVEANVFGGNVPIVIQVSLPSGAVVIDSDMEDTWGAQLWVLTPYHWLKVGAGTNRGKVRQQGQTTNEIDGRYASAQVIFDRWYVRGEANTTQLSTGKTTAQYGQAGVRLGKGFWLNAEISQSHMDMDATPYTPPLDYYPTKDKAMGISYAASPNVVLKLENHWFKGFDVDEFVSVAGEPVETNFLILSVSAAF